MHNFILDEINLSDLTSSPNIFICFTTFFLILCRNVVGHLYLVSLSRVFAGNYQWAPVGKRTSNTMTASVLVSSFARIIFYRHNLKKIMIHYNIYILLVQSCKKMIQACRITKFWCTNYCAMWPIKCLCWSLWLVTDLLVIVSSLYLSTRLAFACNWTVCEPNCIPYGLVRKWKGKQGVGVGWKIRNMCEKLKINF